MEQNKKEQNKSKTYKNTASFGNTIKEVAELPGEIGKTMQKEMSDMFQKATIPLRAEFKPKDLLQIIIGASILAVPVGFTEETWKLGSQLPLENIIFLAGISIIFISTFVYYNYYKKKFLRNWFEFTKRVLFTYVFSLAVVAGLLTVIEVTPWSQDAILSIKRVILVAFPASMSAVVADTIK